MSALTQKLLGAEHIWSPINFFVFGGTLFIYGLHRSGGISRLQTFLQEKRYGVIFRYRKHIKIYAILGLLLAGYNFFLLQRSTQFLLGIPCLLALGYVLPFLRKKKRLRDINDIKIFLIAICWAGLTVVIPAWEMGFSWSPLLLILAIERALFIFLLTLPFDIRDLKVDAYKEVKTLPFRLGIAKTRFLGLGVSLLLIGFSALAFSQGRITLPTFVIVGHSYLIAYICLHFSHSNSHDYYFTGLIDGLMLLQALPILLIY